MNASYLLVSAILVTLLTGCGTVRSAANAQAPIESLYQTQLFGSEEGRPLPLATLASLLRDADVVFIGEIHGHNGAHLFQSRLQLALHGLRPRQVLSMEQFSVDHQDSLNAYLSGEIGEAELIEQADAWPNYRASYRPLVEFARRNDLPVIAANAPPDIARCVAREGAAYLEKLDAGRRKLVPEEPFYSKEGYREKFAATMESGGHGAMDGETTRRLFKAQLLRDNTMAHSIQRAHLDHPGHQIIHVNGRFHSEEGLGAPAALAHRNPDLKIRIVTPVIADDPEKPAPSAADLAQGDFVYLLQPLPPEYIDPERRKAAMEAHFAPSSSPGCGAKDGS